MRFFQQQRKQKGGKLEGKYIRRFIFKKAQRVSANLLPWELFSRKNVFLSLQTVRT
jgi:hypothetical protein